MRFTDQLLFVPLFALVVAFGLARADDSSHPVLAVDGSFSGGTSTVSAFDPDSRNHCLSSDGRIATVARLSTGTEGLICVDAGGPHLIVESGEPDPFGDRFESFSQCSFADDGSLVFAGRVDREGTGQDSVYRAGGSSVVRLFGDYDVVSNGTTIEDWGTNVTFTTNSRGHVLANARARGEGLFLERDGALEAVRYAAAAQWALSDSDAVVVLDSSILQLWGIGTISAVVSSETLAGGPYRYLTQLAVGGDLALFRAAGPDGTADREFVFRVGDAGPQEIPALPADAEILQVTPGGELLIRAGGHYSRRATQSADLSPIATEPDVSVFGINDRGNAAFNGSSAIRLSGPQPDPQAHCPVRPSPGSQPSRSPTPTRTPASTPTAIRGEAAVRAYAVDAAADSVVVIDTATLQPIARVDAPHSPRALVVSPDGSRIFVLGDLELGVIDAVHLQLLRRIPLDNQARHLLASPDNVHAIVDSWPGILGRVRIAFVDGDTGVITSRITGAREKIAAISPDGATLFAFSTAGDPCRSTSSLHSIDAATGNVLNSADIGQDGVSAAVNTAGTRVYSVDNCTHQVSAVDLATFASVATYQLEYQPTRISVAPDDKYVYVEHYSGYVSAINLFSGTVTTVYVGGGTGGLAVTPDSRFAFFTLGSKIEVLDSTTNSIAHSIDLISNFSDIAIAKAPGENVPSPTISPSRPRLYFDPVAGVPGDDIPLTINFDSAGTNVEAIDVTLSTGSNSPLLPDPSGLADCRLAPELELSAQLERGGDCRNTCLRTQLQVKSLPGNRLPDHGPLFTCTANIGPRVQGPLPLILFPAVALSDADEEFPVATEDGVVLLLSRDNATPRATRTPWPTLTPQPTYSPTATPEPVVIEARSLNLVAGDSGHLTVVLHTHGSSVAGIQNDLSFSADAAVAGASGKPLCSVNPAINKSNSTFTFLPSGCGSEAEPCTRVRAIILSFEDVAMIADGSEVYSCTVRGADHSGLFPIQVTRAFASDARGASLPALGIDAEIVVGMPAATATQLSTAGPAATSDGGNDTAGGSGCNVVPPSHVCGTMSLWLLLPLLRRRRR
ncbi:MAG: hypothetical protein HY270_18325 [Deltaproteobacteria bacterium]|nr:hypothetical protein [Deltaproteobacteria bacterium]